MRLKNKVAIITAGGSGMGREGVTMGDIYRSIIPFVILQAIGLATCMIFPQVVLWLPGLMD